MTLLDRHTLHRLNDVVATLSEAFDQYQFHKYYQVMQNFCVQDLSNLYFDVVKDCLYADQAEGTKRRAVQTVLFRLLETLPAMLVPVMPHMAEDIWQNIPAQHKPTYGQPTPPDSICLSPWPVPNTDWTMSDADQQQMLNQLSLKQQVNQALEHPRAEKIIGGSLEARVVLISDTAFAPEDLGEFGKLSDFLLVSDVQHESNTEGQNVSDVIGRHESESGQVLVFKADGDKCPRCWRFATSVGSHNEHPDICDRCVDVVTK
jgi:isoleucyl-tRNA synthetase